MSEIRQYISQTKFGQLEAELDVLQKEKIPALAQRIDEARQLGDLSENAEYHAAREEMAWVQSRVRELQHILEHAEVVGASTTKTGIVGIGSQLTVQVRGVKKKYTIVGAQEANPGTGCISNESPLGQAFFGKKSGEVVEVKVPSGVQVFEILDVQ